MVISLGRSVASTDPHIRPMDPRRDGVALADLLETAFRDEPADEEGQAMLRMLRNFGVFDVAMTDGATGFLWIEEGRIVGNASLMRNRARSDTWVVGNVGTHPSFRGRGIATALVMSCMRYVEGRGGTRVALEVSQSNAPAMRVYQRLGFAVTGLVAHYARPALGTVPLETSSEAPGPIKPRPSGWRETKFFMPSAPCAAARPSIDGVSMVPGQIQLQRMPLVMKSAATARVRAATAALVAPYT